MIEAKVKVSITNEEGSTLETIIVKSHVDAKDLAEDIADMIKLYYEYEQ